MYCKSLNTKEIDGKLMLVWKESNYCHSDSSWHTPIIEIKEIERNLDDGRFINYLRSFPDGSDWQRSNIHDGITYSDGKGLIETIEWIAKHTNCKWAMLAGQINAYWFEDTNDRYRFAKWVAVKPDIVGTEIPPTSVIHLDLGDFLK